MSWRLWVIFGSSLVALGACSARPQFPLEAPCDLTTDCEAPYVCRLDVCRQECREVRDCSPGLLCILDPERFGVCQTSDERECSLASDCPSGLECRFGTCTNACETDRDCLNGLVCAEESPMVLACMDPTMKECVRNTDCADPLICARDQRCREECLEPRDCRDGKICGDVRGFGTCVSGSMDGGMDAGADGAVDAGLDGGVDAATAIVPPDPPFAVLATSHGCALDGGALRCWGANLVGQIGIGSTSMIYQPPVTIPLVGLGTPRAHALGSDHTCVLADNVHCWGDNSLLQLGVGAGTVTMAASPVTLPADVVGLAVGASHTCAWTASSIHCWGANASGQLGNGGISPSAGPSSLTIGGGVIHMALGDEHSCALRADGQVYCWGNNDAMELGTGGSTGATSPSPSLVSGAVSLASGARHTCAILTDATVTCWGLNDDAQLGAGTADTFGVGRGPTAVGVSNAIQVAAGAAHTCVLDSAGLVQCFGRNGVGQSGQSIATLRVFVPFAPTFSLPVVSVFAAGQGTCAKRASGSIECIGRNRGGGMGVDPATTDFGPTPTTVTW